MKTHFKNLKYLFLDLLLAAIAVFAMTGCIVDAHEHDRDPHWPDHDHFDDHHDDHHDDDHH